MPLLPPYTKILTSIVADVFGANVFKNFIVMMAIVSLVAIQTFAIWFENPFSAPDLVNQTVRQLCTPVALLVTMLLSTLRTNLIRTTWSRGVREQRRTTQIQEKSLNALINSYIPDRFRLVGNPSGLDLDSRGDAEKGSKRSLIETEDLELVTVLFCSLDKQSVCQTDASEYLQLLSSLVSNFDCILQETKYAGLFKVENVGFDYIVTSSVLSRGPEAEDSHQARKQDAVLLVRLAQEILTAGDVTNRALKYKVGLHSGPAIGAVCGVQRRFYRLFGDTVNTAARMCSHAEPEGIQISETTHALILGSDIVAEHRGCVDVKGKGKMHTYRVELPEVEPPRPDSTTSSRRSTSLLLEAAGRVAQLVRRATVELLLEATKNTLPVSVSFKDQEEERRRTTRDFNFSRREEMAEGSSQATQPLTQDVWCRKQGESSGFVRRRRMRTNSRKRLLRSMSSSSVVSRVSSNVLVAPEPNKTFHWMTGAFLDPALEAQYKQVALQRRASQARARRHAGCGVIVVGLAYLCARPGLSTWAVLWTLAVGGTVIFLHIASTLCMCSQIEMQVHVVTGLVISFLALELHAHYALLALGIHSFSLPPLPPSLGGFTCLLLPSAVTIWLEMLAHGSCTLMSTSVFEAITALAIFHFPRHVFHIDMRNLWQVREELRLTLAEPGTAGCRIVRASSLRNAPVSSASRKRLLLQHSSNPPSEQPLENDSMIAQTAVLHKFHWLSGCFLDKVLEAKYIGCIKKRRWDHEQAQMRVWSVGVAAGIAFLCTLPGLSPAAVVCVGALGLAVVGVHAAIVSTLKLARQGPDLKAVNGMHVACSMLVSLLAIILPAQYALAGIMMHSFSLPPLTPTTCSLISFLLPSCTALVLSAVYDTAEGMEVLMIASIAAATFFHLPRRSVHVDIRILWQVAEQFRAKRTELAALMFDFVPSVTACSTVMKMQMAVEAKGYRQVYLERKAMWTSPLGDTACVLSTDLVNFTPLAMKLGPHGVVYLLHDLWCMMDSALQAFQTDKRRLFEKEVRNVFEEEDLGDTHNTNDDAETQQSLQGSRSMSLLKEALEPFKVDTVGDAYIVAIMMEQPSESVETASVTSLLGVAKSIATKVSKYSNSAPHGAAPGEVQMRMGLCLGPARSGLVGLLKPRYAVVGEALIRSAELESRSKSFHVNMDEYTCTKVAHLGGEPLVDLCSSVSEIPVESSKCMRA